MIYVASSWRNQFYNDVLEVLRAAKLDFYDFRHPEPGNKGFHWPEIDPKWEYWTPKEFVAGLKHPAAQRGFTCDMEALKACDTLVLVLPCGRSAHLELGYALGQGKPAFIYCPSGYDFQPELMYKAATRICLDMGELLEALGVEN